MRALLGSILMIAGLVAVGLALLRAGNLIDRRPRPVALLAALGPAALLGACVVMSLIIVLLVLGVHFGVLTAIIVAGLLAGGAAAWDRRRTRAARARRPMGPLGPSETPGRGGVRHAFSPALGAGGAVAAVVYGLYGAHALAHVPTRGDDARIWTLRGLTLAFYGSLRPEIFQVQGQSGGHPVYPLFQPGMEALLSKALGSPQASSYHAMLWVILLTALWSAVYLVHRAGARWGLLNIAWLAPVAMVALEASGDPLHRLSGASVNSLSVGDADVTGAVLLALGTLAAGLWLERRRGGFLAFAAVMLATAASTKDEDLLAAGLVLVVLVLATLAWPAPGRLLSRRGVGEWWRRIAPPLAAGVYFVALVAPWRLWCAAHHLTDSVDPPLPKALEPAYVVGRHIYFVQAFDQMVWQVRSIWGWLAALFIVVAVVSLLVRRARRLACFYLAAVVMSVLSLLWLYTTTPLNLWHFLLPTSMPRTIDVFMILAALATAHLLAQLLGEELAGQPSGSAAP